MLFAFQFDAYILNLIFYMLHMNSTNRCTVSSHQIRFELLFPKPIHVTISMISMQIFHVALIATIVAIRESICDKMFYLFNKTEHINWTYQNQNLLTQKSATVVKACIMHQ